MSENYRGKNSGNKSTGYKEGGRGQAGHTGRTGSISRTTAGRDNRNGNTERNKTEGNRTVGNRAEGNRTEGNRTERNGIEGNRTEVNRAGRSRTDGYGTERNKTEGNRTEGNRTGRNRTEGNRTGRSRAGGYGTERNKTEGNGTEGYRTERNRTDRNRTEENKTGRSRTDGYVTERNRTEGYRTERNKTEGNRTVEYRTERNKAGRNRTEGYGIERNSKVRNNSERFRTEENSRDRNNSERITTSGNNFDRKNNVSNKIEGNKTERNSTAYKGKIDSTTNSARYARRSEVTGSKSPASNKRGSNNAAKDINREDYFEDLDYSLLSKEDQLKYGQNKPEKSYGKKQSGRDNQMRNNNQMRRRYPSSKNETSYKSVSVQKSNTYDGNEHSDDLIGKSGGHVMCPKSRACGGCNMKEQGYEFELKEKQETVAQLLNKYCKVEPIIGMKDPTHYRNKVHVVFDHDKKGNPVSGVYEEGTHRVIPVENCLIHNKKADEIIATIRGMLKSFKIKTYDEDSGYGLLRHVLIRVGYASGEIMVVLVLASPIMPSKNNFVKALREKHPEITTIIINVNDKQTSMVLGDKEQVIYGKGYIEDSLCGKVFRISPKSFYQVNPAQTEVIYKKAIDLAGLKGDETVMDAYCGTGTIGIIASDHANHVIGVELNQEAVKDANINAKRNDARNVEFYNNDAGVFMSQMAAQKETVDVVFMDPPRTGSNEQFLDALALLKPKTVVYISCNPVTLERDLAYLTRKGYKAEKAVPVDMFPWTGHVETCVLLTRKNTVNYNVEITVDIDM